MSKCKIGLFSAGHLRYWPQFNGLRERLEEHMAAFEEKIKSLNTDVEFISGGLVDTVERGYETGDLFAEKNVDFLICNVTTYVSSSFIVPVPQRSKAPMIVIGLQPTQGMEPETATTWLQLEHDNATPLTEIICSCERCNITVYDCIFGMLHNDDKAMKKIREWIEVAVVFHRLKNARFGFMGHVHEWMMDLQFDPTMVTAFFGSHVEMLEMGDLDHRTRKVTDAELKQKIKEIKNSFHVPSSGIENTASYVNKKQLEWSAKVAAGLDNLVKDFNIDGLTYYYYGSHERKYVELIAGMIVGSSLLNGKGIPIVSEGDMKTNLAMFITQRFGAGGSYAGLHSADFKNGCIHLGHHGPYDIKIAEKKPVLYGLTLFHDKPVQSASVEFNLRTGPLSMLALTQKYNGQFKFVYAEGESLPGTIPATGCINARGSFTPGIPAFVEKWSKEAPSHHFSLSIEHNLSKIEKLAKILGIELAVVCKANIP